MTRIELLEKLRGFTEKTVKDMLLPVKPLNRVPLQKVHRRKTDEDEKNGGNMEAPGGYEPPNAGTVTQKPEPELRPASVFITRVPDREYTSRAPFILHQAVTGKDYWKPGEQPQSIVVVRSGFCVYGKDEAESGPLLLELMERVRIGLLKYPLLAERFQLDLGAGLETLVYPDSDATAPYALGEMISTWNIPAIKRKAIFI